MFYVGQKVVCISAPRCHCGLCNGLNPAQVGEVYTILRIDSSWGDSPGLLFQEILVPPPHDDFKSCHFRPIVSRPTDISIFTKMLGPTKVREDA